MALAAFLLSAAIVAAAPGVSDGPPPEPTLSAAGRRLIVEQTAKAVGAAYQSPTTATSMSADLRATLGRGGFDGEGTPGELAAALTARLRAISHDRHLGVADPLRPPPASDFTPPPPSMAGFGRVELSPEGVGYVRMAAFPPISIFRPAADFALSRLKGARTVVLDLRSSLGGDPHSAAYLEGAFDARARSGLEAMVVRVPNTRRLRVEPIAAPAAPSHLGAVKLYVLVGPRTFSAPEQVAYDLQTLHRATLVGETTRGGANPTDRAGLAANLWVDVPYGRARNRLTGGNWEGAGVRPEERAPAAEALRRVLEGLAAGAAWPSGRAAALAAAWEAPYAPPSPPLVAADAKLRYRLRSRAAGVASQGDFPTDLDDFASPPPPAAVMRRWGRLISTTPKPGPSLFGERSFEVVFERAVTDWVVYTLPDGTPGPIAFHGRSRAFQIAGSSASSGGEGVLDGGESVARECYTLVDLEARTRRFCVAPGRLRRAPVSWGETACRVADARPPPFPCRSPAQFGAVLLTRVDAAAAAPP